MTSTSREIKQVQLRKAVPSDAEAIAAVRVEAWQTTYRGIVPDDYLDDMKIDDSYEQWLRILQAMEAAPTKVCVYIAECDGHIVGFASGLLLDEEKLGHRAELSAIYLRPGWQRIGIGRRLVHKVARTLQAMGSNSMLVWVIADNKPARDFYEELGGVLLQEQEFSWDGLDLREVAYGWSDLAVLLAAVYAHEGNNSVH